MKLKKFKDANKQLHNNNFSYPKTAPLTLDSLFFLLNFKVGDLETPPPPWKKFLDPRLSIRSDLKLVYNSIVFLSLTETFFSLAYKP